MNKTEKVPAFFGVYILLDAPKLRESGWKEFQQGNLS